MLFDYYTGVKMEPSNLLADMMYSNVEFKMMVLEELVRVLSLNRRIFVTATPLDSKVLHLILLILFRRSIFRLCRKDRRVGSGQKFRFHYRRGKKD